MQQHAVQGETVATCLLWGNIDRKYYTPPQNYLKHVTKFNKDKSIQYPTKGNAYKPNFDNLKIGIHKDTTIAYKGDMDGFKKGYKNIFGFPFLKRTKDQRKTTQIMSFAFNFGHGFLANKTKHPIYSKMTQELLTRQYLMTIWVAYLNGIKTVYLTSLGGLAFKNDPVWIKKAIYNPELQNFIRKSGMEVYLVQV